MAGIYIHIPFCRKACTYCDFHFSTSTTGKERVLNAMMRELEARSHVLGEKVDTIYFGGGTPSFLEPKEIRDFMQDIHVRFEVDASAEVTLEANPDDITQERLDSWRELGITRISLGTQSFREERLRFMGRAHTADQALRSIDLIAKSGFASWSIDLIYGLPGMSLSEWDEQLSIALAHGMPHLSAYCLAVEGKTALAHQVAKGKVIMPEDSDQSVQFDRLMERMESAGIVHYEISNFALPGHLSRHNTSYWEGIPYLGIGPSAHSYDGKARRWNVANNTRYAVALESGTSYWDSETLTAVQRTNELLLTGLRTSKGVLLERLELDALAINHRAVVQYKDKGMLRVKDGRLVLTKAGWHFADRIASDLFVSADDRTDRT